MMIDLNTLNHGDVVDIKIYSNRYEEEVIRRAIVSFMEKDWVLNLQSEAGDRFVYFFEKKKWNNGDEAEVIKVVYRETNDKWNEIK